MPLTPRLTLSVKSYAFFAALIIVAALIAAQLLGGLTQLDEGYRRILQVQIEEQSSVREMQVAFKKQVQEWKNILLRGAVDRDRARYREQFLALRSEVFARADSLAQNASTEHVATEISTFLEEYRALSAAYEAAWQSFDAGGGRAPFRADSAVRGRDRGPTDRIDSIVALIDVEVETLVARQQELARTRRRNSLASFAAFVTLLIAIPFYLQRAVVSPLRRVEGAASRIAAGDLHVQLTHTSADEVGDLAEAFRRMRDALRRSRQELAQSATSVAATAEELSVGAVQLEAATQEVAQAAQGIAHAAAEQTTQVTNALQTAQRVAARADEIAQDGQHTANAARAVEARSAEGRAEMTRASAQLTEAATAAADAIPAVEQLGEKVSEIQRFTDLIAGIANQSKLLALNAAIEAARAAEHGRGFAVVADEVGKLAKDSQDALDHIRRLATDVAGIGRQVGTRLGTVNLATSAGASAFASSERALVAIEQEAHRSTSAATRIGQAIAEQVARTTELSDIIGSLAATAQENAATAQELSALNEEHSAGISRVAAGSRDLHRLAAQLDASLGTESSPHADR